LQHACIFELPLPIDCAAPDAYPLCECALDPSLTKNPMCQASDGTYGSLLRFGSARPAIRQLEVVRGFSEASSVPWTGLGSICAQNLTDPSRSDYGFRPPIAHVMDSLFAVRHELCLDDTFEPDGEGRVECRIVTTSRRDECTCDAELHERTVEDGDILQGVRERLRLLGACSEGTGISCDDYCICELEQLTGTALDACQNDPSEIVMDPRNEGRMLSGWCYVDPDLGFGDPALVANCRPTARRLIRFPDPRTFGRDGMIGLIACSTSEVCEEQ
jgi:hypothetical protein